MVTYMCMHAHIEAHTCGTHTNVLHIGTCKSFIHACLHTSKQSPATGYHCLLSTAFLAALSHLLLTVLQCHSCICILADSSRQHELKEERTLNGWHATAH